MMAVSFIFPGRFQQIFYFNMLCLAQVRRSRCGYCVLSDVLSVNQENPIEEENKLRRRVGRLGFERTRKIENSGMQKDLQEICTKVNAFSQDGTTSRFNFVRDPPR
jgi:hypothetical protein